MADTNVIFRPGWRTWLRFVGSMARATAWYALHPRAPLPGDCGHVTMAIRVPGRARGSQLEALAEIADGLKVEEERAPLDCMTARRHFGCLSVMATAKGEKFYDEYARRSETAADAA